jgi:dihydrofolate reductase
MRTLIADLFISLDGYAAGTNEQAYFGYLGPQLGAWVREEGHRPQVILMGRVTYEMLHGIARSSGVDEATAQMTKRPKLVFSNTLKEPLDWNNTEVLRGDLADAIYKLKSQSGDPIRSFGSIKLVKGLMQLGLIDRLRLLVFPLVLGKTGREPIFSGYDRTKLELVDTKTLDERLVLFEYRPA